MPSARSQQRVRGHPLRSAPAYAEIQKAVGKVLREHYEPPEALPQGLVALLIQVENSGQVP